MKIGVPKEIKTLEFRVGMTPAGVHEVVSDGHEVIVEKDAGAGIGVTDADYEAVGATVVGTAKAVFAAAEMIIKVKEPQSNECAMLRPGQVLFTYLHLAADPAQAEALVKSGTTAIAYETVTSRDGSLPLLTPMSEVISSTASDCRSSPAGFEKPAAADLERRAGFGHRVEAVSHTILKSVSGRFASPSPNSPCSASPPARPPPSSARSPATFAVAQVTHAD